MISLLSTSGSGRPPNAHEREGEAIEAHIVVLEIGAGLTQFTRLHDAITELLFPQKRVRLVEQGAFPLTRLASVVLPGDPGVVGRIVAAVLDISGHRVGDLAYPPAINGESQERGEIALGGTVGRIYALCVAELGDDVPFADHNAIDVAALGRHGPKQAAEHVHLVRQVLGHRRLLGPGPGDCLVENAGVHAQISGRAAFPLVARGIVRFLGLGDCDEGRAARVSKDRETRAEKKEHERDGVAHAQIPC
jgi:hypothetical protein